MEVSGRTVERAVVDRIVSDVSRRPLVVIQAPEATGKSTILRQLRSRVARQASVRMFESSRARDADALLAEFLRTEDSARPQLIIIDDAERISAEILSRIIGALADQPPDSARSVILSSNRPLAAPLSALRMSGRISEYGLIDLNLSHAEAAAMLDLGIAEMMSTAFRILMRRSEGWVGAMRLIKDVMEGGQGLEATARWMHGDAREFSCYFEEQVMGPLSPELRRFIVLTAPIWPLNADLVYHLHGDDAPALLRAAHLQCPFLGTDRPGAPPARPNPLFVEYLIAEGRRAYPVNQRQMFRNAGSWFEERADWPRAAHHYVLAGDPNRAGDMLSTKSDDIFARFGDVFLVEDDGGVHGPLAKVPPQGAATDLIRGTLLRNGARREERSDVGEFGELLANFGRDDLSAVRVTADKWLSDGTGSALQRATVANALAVTHLAELRIVDMQQALERATSASTQARSPFLNAWSSIGWAFLYLERGNASLARQVVIATLEDPSVDGLVRHTVRIILAACERLLGNIPAASELINSSIDLSSQHSTSDTMVLGWSTAAYCALHQAGLDEALKLLKRAARIAGRRSGERSQYLLRLFSIHLALQAGDRDRLASKQEEFDQIKSLAAETHFGRRFDEQLRLVGARLQLACGNLREASSIVQPIIQRSQTAGRAKRWTEAMMIRIGIAIAEGNLRGACRLFWHCEAGIGGDRLHQLLLDDRRLLAPIAPSIRDQASKSGFEPQQIRLAEAIAAPDVRLLNQIELPRSGNEQLDAESLTRKERDVVQLVASGLSNEEIGGRLGVAEVTVKWHLRNIFQKLGVRSRTAAVAKLEGRR